MFASGFIDEVRMLLDKGYDRNLPAMSGLGYPEVVAYLQDELKLDEAITKSKSATHDFIRRQDVWFKGHDNGILWHQVDDIKLDIMIGQISAHF